MRTKDLGEALSTQPPDDFKKTAAEAAVKTEHDRKWTATQKAKLQKKNSHLSTADNSLASRRAYSRYSELFLKQDV